ncbi:hypothetical protein BMR99_09980 [Propionibacterium freudenreichii]|nr:hypothetical protein BMR99_09980 [Propionibacterium freudenreichii]
MEPLGEDGGVGQGVGAVEFVAQHGVAGRGRAGDVADHAEQRQSGGGVVRARQLHRCLIGHRNLVWGGLGSGDAGESPEQGCGGVVVG